VEGVYPDSLLDFKATREMARWDGYTPSDAYWEGYSQGSKYARVIWHSPWYYSSYYPWYDSWYWDPWYYDPWYYSSWHYGWYDPWYYGGYWGWDPITTTAGADTMVAGMAAIMAVGTVATMVVDL
jgi:hypothetical protein